MPKKKFHHDVTVRADVSAGAFSINDAALKELEEKGLGISDDVLIYSFLRWCETSGKSSVPFMIDDTWELSERFGMTVREVENTLNHLQRVGLIQHVWCNKKVYRGKSKAWISTKRLESAGINLDTVKVLDRGKRNEEILEADPHDLKAVEYYKTRKQVSK